MTQPNFSDSEQPFLSHLIELRTRLMYIVLAVLLIFLCLAPFANEIYSYLSVPLMKHLPENSTMVAIDVASPFFTPFKLSLVCAGFIAVPVILYQIWAFVAPGLYAHEKRLVLPLLIASTALFYIGVAFAYFVVLPLVFAFLTTTAPVGVTVMTDIAKYLDFTLTLFLAFGVTFEVPIFTIVLVWTGFVSPTQLSEARPYIIVGAFVVAMFLTPPDALSQTLLAVPLCLLFEAGLLFTRFFIPKSHYEDNDEKILIAKE
jgi:sec-independent protein translocase protein TatC